MWWGSRCGSITSQANRWLQLGQLPGLPPSYDSFGTMYPHTATISPLALDPNKNYAPGFVIFGGGSQASVLAECVSWRGATDLRCTARQASSSSAVAARRVHHVY